MLTALRWLPVGVVTPVVVLTATARGLSVVDVGLVFSVQAVLVIALELPTGGLADAVGRRAVLLASAALNVLALLLLVQVQSTGGFAAAFALLAVARALDSGPLEAWFVDVLTDLEGPRADPATGLAWAGAATGAALTVGAVTGGAVPSLTSGTLAVPYLVAAAVTALQALLVLAWVGRPSGHRSQRAGAAVRRGVRAVPRTVALTLRSASADPALRIVLLLALGTGVALGAMELLAPLRVAELYGSADDASRAYGLVVAAGFGAMAVGSAVAPAVRRLTGASTSRAIGAAFAVGAAAMTGFALASGVGALAAAFVGVYLATGCASPLRQQTLHSRTGSAQRATLVSAGSLALQVGGLVSNVAGPALGQVAGPDAPFLGAAAVLAVLALLATRLPPGPRSHPS